MVFWVAVWGPPFRGTFFADTCVAIRAECFQAGMFADDLHAWRAVSTGVSDLGGFSSVRRCRAPLRAWGRANRVQFDAGKGGFHILSRVQPVGDDWPSLAAL
eukprot:6975616-Pyramimonas_sp.AAC.1